jgi:hypothetical protein
MAQAGAGIVDVGGESTRPGAVTVAPGDERKRVMPVVRELVARGITVSIDTMHASTALAAVDAGAEIINDVSGGLGDEGMARVVAPSVEILAAAVGDPLNPTILLESADIAAAITGDDPTMPVSVQSVIAHPDQPNWLFIAAAIHPEIESQNNYILAFQRDTAEITVALDMTDNSLGSPLQIILDGQYLAFSSFGAAPISSILAPFIGLIPLEPADMTIGSPIESYRLNSGFNHDWSQDGRWLLLVEQNALRLIAPGHNYDQTIAHNLDFCYEAAWINPSPE